ncbi:MAG: CDP-diacylglycerol O-phosphatidyltransferase [Candidatus Marinimicrobia bacterium]|nr:CDP-diacylglycerol O-phosphatidyltransferase [Candidatus Neomarinimicrobiota bacterium]
MANDSQRSAPPKQTTDDEFVVGKRRFGRAANRLRSLSFNRILPNVLTLVALCAGLTAIRYGMSEDWGRAVIALVIATTLDGIDGRVARLLRGTTKFGAELDSLGDAISFGVAPAILMYQWVMSGAGSFGWALCLLHAVCCVLRLARFNTMVGQPDLPVWAHNYFTGVPAPGGAGLSIMPLILWLYTGMDVFAEPLVAGAFLLISSILMVSRVPVYSGKHVRLKPFLVLPLMILIGVMAGFLVTDPFATLSFVGAAYLASIMASFWSFRRLQSRADKMKT